ncbi:MAG: hypothetical protein QXW94_01970 [Desulfurococcaceae archaeon]
MPDKSSVLRRIWYAAITSIIIQSVWIGGGYGSGREIIEFIAKYGSIGWIAILIGAITLLIALIPSFEVARVFKAYDYMTWAKQFLWKFWWIFDIAFIVLAWIVIAIVGAAAGYMLSDLAGIPYWLSAVIVLIVVALLHFYGRKAIEAWWIVGTIGLYVMYAIIWAVILFNRGSIALSNISSGISQGTPTEAIIDGFKYTMYNLCVVMPALQSIDRYKGKFESLVATIIGVALIYGAAVALWVCFMAFYPEVINWTVPLYDILKAIGVPWALAIYVFWIFYTLIETALGMVYSIVRRVDSQLKLHGKSLGRRGEALLSATIFVVSIVTAQVGLVTLVAQGYGTMAWVFFAVYFVPIVTIGLLRVIKPDWKKEFWTKA